jgi:hypothetical protein
MWMGILSKAITAVKLCLPTLQLFIGWWHSWRLHLVSEWAGDPFSFVSCQQALIYIVYCNWHAHLSGTCIYMYECLTSPSLILEKIFSRISTSRLNRLFNSHLIFTIKYWRLGMVGVLAKYCVYTYHNMSYSDCTTMFVCKLWPLPFTQYFKITEKTTLL